MAGSGWPSSADVSSSPTPTTARLVLSDHERSLYDQHFTEADAAAGGAGQLGGAQAAQYLSTSGLGYQVLGQIWDIADADRRGYLGRDDFAVALRLIAHAQSGREVSRELIGVMPSELPRLGSSESHLPGTFSRSKTALSSVKLPSQNNTSAASPLGTSSSSLSGASRRGRSPPRGEDRAMPSPRDMRKYGRLFCKLARGHHVGSQEARNLFSCSSLSNDVLDHVWTLADVDGDGSLSWREFVSAMHLIRRALSDQPLPPASHGLPSDLTTFLGSLDEARVYASQESRSPRSPSGSEVPTPLEAAFTGTNDDKHNAPTSSVTSLPRPFAAPVTALDRDVMQNAYSCSGTERHYQVQDSFTSPHIVDFQHSKSSSVSEFGSSLRGRGSPLDSGLAKFRGESRTIPIIGNAPMSSETSLPTDVAKRDASFVKSGSGTSNKVESLFADDSQTFQSNKIGFAAGTSELEYVPARDMQPVEHLEAIIEADKMLLRRLSLDIDRLEKDLTRIEDGCRLEETEARQEHDECERISAEKKHLSQQLEAFRRQIGALKREHKGLHTESVVLRRNHIYYGQEAAFLQRVLDEGQRDTQALENSLEYLEHSQNNLVVQTHSLRDVRREVLEQIRAQEDSLERERKELPLIRQALEALRGGTVDIHGLSTVTSVAGGVGCFDDGIGGAVGGISLDGFGHRSASDSLSGTGGGRHFEDSHFFGSRMNTARQQSKGTVASAGGRSINGFNVAQREIGAFRHDDEDVRQWRQGRPAQETTTVGCFDREGV
eukprot:TRINITY_DN34625_c0_g2_i1.p1 TRINITY_DN34625_c0_g2~~TRINITY_DN34625_c0_g2_i1.p1  ORF type:complete len:775 (-),score=106.93 TRINITY_DN34625_c0_g2_i1:701-3025(-)